MLLVCFLVMSGGLLCLQAIPDKQVVTPHVLYTLTAHYQPLAWVDGADRFIGSAQIYIRDERGSRALLPDFAASADPAVSFDGQRMLFAGKRTAQDGWQIWEASSDGNEPRRIANCEQDCVRPFYLPEDRIVYARKRDGRFALEASGLDGVNPVQLTHIPGNALPSDVLRDGRILFEATYPLGSGKTPELYTVYSDGSGVEAYRCDHGTPRYAGKQVSSGDIVFTSGGGLSRFTSALAHQETVAAKAGEYADGPVELATGNWLFSWRTNSHSNFQILRGTPGAGEPIISATDADVVQPTPITERAVPNWHPSGLHDWPNANLLCLNAYTSKHKFPAGAIHAVRLYARDNSGSIMLLGTSPVEQDGSFFIQVPADKPLQIELLDASGKTLQREAGWFWTRRGEQRGCVGCHAGPETAPENAVPLTLLKSTTPFDMTGATPMSAGGH
jgi:hypothetical protein